jgi:CheY-like chemotaxis protein
MGRILVIDDDPAIIEVLEIVLQDEGYEVQGDDGTTIGKSLSWQPDVILLDVWMRGVDGRQIAGRIKNQGWPSKIILMSAHSDAAKTAAETEADAFIAKPFELDELVELIKQQLS